jgi:hypothetical protein
MRHSLEPAAHGVDVICPLSLYNLDLRNDDPELVAALLSEANHSGGNGCRWISRLLSGSNRWGKRLGRLGGARRVR